MGGRRSAGAGLACLAGGVLAALLWVVLERTGAREGRAPREDAPSARAGGAGSPALDASDGRSPAEPAGVERIPIPPSRAAWIEGRVARSVVGDETERGWVSIELRGVPLEPGGESHELEAEADDEGRFDLGPLDPGRVYVMHVDAGEEWLDPPDRELRLAPGERRALILTIASAARVSGRVLDPSGAPVRGAWVGDHETAEDGSYALGGLPPGAVELLVRVGGRVLACRRVTLAPGERREDAHIVVEVVSISGTVRLPDGRAAGLAHVEATGVAFGRVHRIASTSCDERGRFVLAGLPPGTCDVRVEATIVGESAEQSARYGIAHLPDVATGASGLEVVVASAPELVGTVRTAEGLPVREFDLSAEPVERRLRYHATRVRCVDGEKRFRLPVAVEGEWWLEVRTEHGSARRRVRVPQEAPLEVVVAEREPRFVHGRVVDPEGGPVSAFVEFPPMLLQGGPTAPDGSFVLEAPDGAIGASALCEGFAQSACVALPEDDSAIVLRLRRGARVVGHVREEGGRRLAGRLVSCSSGVLRVTRSERTCLTDAAGRFEMAGLAPGLLDSWLDGGAAGTLRRSRLASDGETVEVEFTVPAERPVRVHGVVTGSGAPAPNVRVFTLLDGELARESRTDAEGRYDLMLHAPGRHAFFLGTEEIAAVGARFDVEVPPVDELIQDFELPEGRLEGTVLDEAGRPLAFARVRLARVAGDRAWLGEPRSTTREGRFVFEHLFPGLHAVSVCARDDVSHGAALLNGIDVDEDRPAEVELRLERPARLRVEVRASNGMGLPDALVQLSDLRGNGLSLGGSCDALGRADLDGLPPGSFRVRARLADHVSPAHDVELGPGDDLALVLRLGERDAR